MPPALQFEPIPTRKCFTGITPQKQRQFIAHLAGSGCVEMAAKAIGISDSALYTRRKQPGAESFAAAWDVAVEMGARRVLDTLMGHAIHGTPETLLKDGKVVLERRKFNTRSMMWIVQQRFPEQYGGSLNLSGKPASAMPHAVKRLKEQWRKEWEAEMPTEEEVNEVLVKRLKALGKRALYARALKFVGMPEHMAAYDLLYGPQDWADIAKVKARREEEDIENAERMSRGKQALPPPPMSAP